MLATLVALHLLVLTQSPAADAPPAQGGAAEAPFGGNPRFPRGRSGTSCRRSRRRTARPSSRPPPSPPPRRRPRRPRAPRPPRRS